MQLEVAIGGEWTTLTQEESQIGGRTMGEKTEYLYLRVTNP